MEGSAALGGFSDGGVYELTGRIMAADVECIVGRAFPNDVSTGVRHVAERTCVRWGVAISFG